MKREMSITKPDRASPSSLLSIVTKHTADYKRKLRTEDRRFKKWSLQTPQHLSGFANKLQSRHTCWEVKWACFDCSSGNSSGVRWWILQNTPELEIRKDGISSTKLTQSQYFLEHFSCNSLYISHLLLPKRTLSTCFGAMVHWNG